MYKNPLKVTTILCSLAYMPMLSMASATPAQPTPPTQPSGDVEGTIYNSHTGHSVSIKKTAEGDITASSTSGSYAVKNVETHDTSTATVYNSKTGTTTTAEKDHVTGDISASNTRGGNVVVDTQKGGGADVTVTTHDGRTKTGTYRKK